MQSETLNQILFDQAELGNLDIIKRLVELKGVDIDYCDTESGDTVLHIAAFNGRTEVVKYLISKGANVDNVGRISKKTPLSIAVEERHVETAKTLIEHGAKTNFVKRGRNLLDIAIDSLTPNTEMIVLLLDAGLNCAKRDSDDENLIIALTLSACNARCIRYLVSIGANVNFGVGDFEPPLFQAVYEGNIETASLLIELGARTDIEIYDQNLMDSAIFPDRPEMIEFLIEHGLDIHGRDPGGKPYLALAIEYNSQKSIHYLLESVRVDYWLCSEPDGRTALFYVHSKEICQKLLEHIEKREGREAMIRYLNHRDAQGQTVLHAVSKSCKPSLLKLLVSLGANPNIRDNNRKRPQDLVNGREIKELFASYILIENGLN